MPLHILGVVLAVLKGGGGLISSMITGRKLISDRETNQDS